MSASTNKLEIKISLEPVSNLPTASAGYFSLPLKPGKIRLCNARYTVRVLAKILGKKSFEIKAHLIRMGFFVTDDEVLDIDTTCAVFREYGFTPEKV